MSKYACKRDMTEAGQKEDNTTNSAAWSKTLYSYTCDPRWRKPGKKMKKKNNNKNNLFFCSMLLIRPACI